MSTGLPLVKGMAAALEYASDVDGVKIQVIRLDDGSDQSSAARNARKLVEDEKIDNILMGSSTAPASIAMAYVANELKVPMIALANYCRKRRYRG